MTERREPTISAMRPEKDDASRSSGATQTSPQGERGRSNGGGTRKASAAEQRAKPNRAPSRPAQPVVVKSALAPFAFLLALVGVGFAGFAYWQLLETQKLLVSAEERIVSLESKFELTDDELNASSATIQAKLKWADSEIRKLWGVSYDTNRKAIATNKTSLARTEKLAKQAAGSVDAKIKSALKDATSELKLLSDLVDAQQVSLSSIETKNAQTVAQGQGLADKLNRLDSLSGELKRRVKTNEQAIEAIDAFRRSVNQQLLQLKSATP